MASTGPCREAAGHVTAKARKSTGSDVADRRRRRRWLLGCAIAAMVLLFVVLPALWWAFRLPWRHDPLEVGVIEELIEARGYTFQDTAPGDGLEGYVLWERNQKQWASRHYRHARTTGWIELRRRFDNGELRSLCRVISRNAEGREALFQVVGEFSPSLLERTRAAEVENRKTSDPGLVLALDLKIRVTRKRLVIEACPRDDLVRGEFRRMVGRCCWRISELCNTW